MKIDPQIPQAPSGKLSETLSETLDRLALVIAGARLRSGPTFVDYKIARAIMEARDAAYWRNAYEALVKQTGRDLNDGLGIDPRSRAALENRT